MGLKDNLVPGFLFIIGLVVVLIVGLYLIFGG